MNTYPNLVQHLEDLDRLDPMHLVKLSISDDVDKCFLESRQSLDYCKYKTELLALVSNYDKDFEVAFNAGFLADAFKLSAKPTDKKNQVITMQGIAPLKPFVFTGDIEGMKMLIMPVSSK